MDEYKILKPIFLVVLLSIAGSAIGGCFQSEGISIEPLAEKWGKGTVHDDRRVVDALLECSRSVHYHDMTPRFLNALTNRIQEKPELLSEIFGSFCESFPAPECDDTGWFIARFANATQESRLDQNIPRVITDIFLAASMFNRPEWVSDLRWNEVIPRSKEVSTWLEQNMYYAVYDFDKKFYIIDETAREQKKRVVPSRQSWIRCNKPAAFQYDSQEHD